MCQATAKSRCPDGGRAVLDPLWQIVFGQPGELVPCFPLRPVGQRGVAETPQRGCGCVLQAGSAWHFFKASPSFLALPELTASLLQRKAVSYLGLSPAS